MKITKPAVFNWDLWYEGIGGRTVESLGVNQILEKNVIYGSEFVCLFGM